MTTDTTSLSELVRALHDTLRAHAIVICNSPATSNHLFHYECKLCDFYWYPNDPEVHSESCLAALSRLSSVGVGEEDVEPPASGLEVSEWVLHAASEAYLQHDGQVDMIGLEAALKVAIHHGCFCPHCNPPDEHERNVQAAFDGAPLCDECGINHADAPSKLCPGCQAHREHQR